MAIELAREILTPCVPAGWHLEAESLTLLGSEFEPAVMISRGTAEDYVEEHPGPADLALVIEISDSTLARDQGFKKAVYEKAVIPVYWIVNLVDRRVEVYTNPGQVGEKPDYRQRQDYGEADNAPLVVAGQEVAQDSRAGVAAVGKVPRQKTSAIIDIGRHQGLLMFQRLRSLFSRFEPKIVQDDYLGSLCNNRYGNWHGRINFAPLHTILISGSAGACAAERYSDPIRSRCRNSVQRYLAATARTIFADLDEFTDGTTIAQLFDSLEIYCLSFWQLDDRPFIWEVSCVTPLNDHILRS